MTPKEKAQELIDKFHIKVHDREGTSAMNEFEAKQCALIAVDEIIEVTAPNCDRYEPYYLELKAEMTQKYWQEVKQEIETYNTKRHIIEIMIADEEDGLYNELNK